MITSKTDTLTGARMNDSRLPLDFTLPAVATETLTQAKFPFNYIFELCASVKNVITSRAELSVRLELS